MENKNLSELRAICKEWGAVIGKTFHQIDREIGLKGWLFVIFGVIIISLLGNITHSIGERGEKKFKGDRGYMMQERGEMPCGRTQGLNQDTQKGMKQQRGMNEQNAQGCTQQQNIAIDPQNPNNKIITSQINCPFADDESTRMVNQVIPMMKINQSMFDRIENKMKQIFNGNGTIPLETQTPGSPIIIEMQ